MSEREPLVSGRIVFGGEVKSFTGATAYVRLEDVSRADASATTVAEQVIEGVSHQAGKEEAVIFNLYGDLPEERSDYSVRVHVDVDGDGEISVGDYISTESYPVLTSERPARMDVRVEEVI